MPITDPFVGIPGDPQLTGKHCGIASFQNPLAWHEIVAEPSSS